MDGVFGTRNAVPGLARFLYPNMFVTTLLVTNTFVKLGAWQGSSKRRGVVGSVRRNRP